MNRRAIATLSVGHFLTDLCQGTVPALLPFLVAERHFSYTAAASLVFAISAASSVVQPLFGQVADRLALSWLLPTSALLTGAGLALGAQATAFAVVLAAFALCGLGVAAFHPEAARQAHHASGARRATGMSLFTVGGVLGFALAPTLTTALAVGWGTKGVLALLVPTGVVALLLARSAGGVAASPLSHRSAPPPEPGRDDWGAFATLSGATICRSIVFFGLNTFLALYFMSRWGQTAAEGNRALAVFLGTSIAGTLLGGWLADRFGRRAVLRVGFLGAVIFLTLFMLASDRLWALALLAPLALCIFLPSSVQVVLGQEYLPNRVGMASGVTLGLAVSVGGMVTPVLGRLADRHGVGIVLVALLGVQLLALALAFALPSSVGSGGDLRSNILRRLGGSNRVLVANEAGGSVAVNGPDLQREHMPDAIVDARSGVDQYTVQGENDVAIGRPHANLLRGHRAAAPAVGSSHSTSIGPARSLLSSSRSSRREAWGLTSAQHGR